MKKLLIICNNKNIDGLFNKIDNNKYENKHCDIFINQKFKSINELYYACDKIYTYYLFINDNITIENKDTNKNAIDQIIFDLITYKPCIMKLSYNIKIYHRSIIHYIYPNINNYEEEIYKLNEILEIPFKKYNYNNNNLIINSEKDLLLNYTRNNVNNWSKLYNWFKSCIKFDIMKEKNDKNEKNIIDKMSINEINFMNKIDIYKYFDTDHKIFEYKRIKFHKKNREIYGQCGTYHFAHDFRNANRNSIINHLIKINNYDKYLEIGTNNCYHFDDVIIKNKTGVDPYPDINDKIYQKWNKNIHVKTSKDYFIKLNENIKYDIIFIDGCLIEDNIQNDIENSLNHINDNGSIVIHDCNPPNEFLQRDNIVQKYNADRKIMWNNRKYTDKHWNGKVWKVIVKLRKTRDDLDVCVVDTDWGMGIIKKKQTNNINKEKLMKIDENELYNYNTLIKYRKYMLNLISVEEFLETWGGDSQSFPDSVEIVV